MVSPNFLTKTLMIVYRGDDTIDVDTCKNHSRLHDLMSYKWIGSLMQSNTELGERGLKDWAKKISKTARKLGVDYFTFNTSLRIGEKMLFDSVRDLAVRLAAKNSSISAEETEDQELTSEHDRPCYSIRKVSPFTFVKYDFDNVLCRDRFGKCRKPDQTTGSIHRKVLELEAMQWFKPDQLTFDIFCEAKLPNGEWIRCTPQYRSNQGPRYDWAMVSFPDDAGGTMNYPAKILGLYKDLDDNLNAIIQSVEYKMRNGRESTLGDSRLVTHYRLEFKDNGNPALRSVPFEDIKCCILAFESKACPCLTTNSLIPMRHQSSRDQYKHTVMVLCHKSEESMCFSCFAAPRPVTGYTRLQRSLCGRTIIPDNTQAYKKIAIEKKAA